LAQGPLETHSFFLPHFLGFYSQTHNFPSHLDSTIYIWSMENQNICKLSRCIKTVSS
jgi:hypothetical protein